MGDWDEDGKASRLALSRLGQPTSVAYTHVAHHRDTHVFKTFFVHFKELVPLKLCKIHGPPEYSLWQFCFHVPCPLAGGTLSEGESSQTMPELALL